MNHEQLILEYARWLQSLSTRIWEYGPKERREVLDLVLEIRGVIHQSNDQLNDYMELLRVECLFRIELLLHQLEPHAG